MVVQVFHWSAVNPEKLDAIFKGIRPIVEGSLTASTRCCIFQSLVLKLMRFRHSAKYLSALSWQFPKTSYALGLLPEIQWVYSKVDEVAQCIVLLIDFLVLLVLV